MADDPLLLKGNPYTAVRQAFIDGAGHIAVSLLGLLNRVCGQIYALLYLSPKPLSLDDIVDELGVSKGSVSVNIRILEDYKLVRKIWVKGSRKDYYEASDTIPHKILKEFFEKIKRNILDSRDMVGDCLDMLQNTKALKGAKEEGAFIEDRLTKIKSFYEAASVLMTILYSGEKLDTSIFKPFLEGNSH